MKTLIFIFLMFFNFLNKSNWLIVGGGPAGIIATSVLLEIGIPGEDILWVDPEFNVGGLSQYKNTPANTKNKLFAQFLNSFKLYKEIDHESLRNIFNLSPEKEYKLYTIIKPLQVISDYLCEYKVNYIKSDLLSLFFKNNRWIAQVVGGKVSASHVVLATGSSARSLNLGEANKNKNIPLSIALDKKRLCSVVNADDRVAVIGSSHSAILAVKFLYSCGVKEIINFYNKPLTYTVDMGDWQLNPSTGLKGSTARWAKEVLENNPPKNIKRIFSSKENLDRELPSCTKIVQAVGFKRNEIKVNGCKIPKYDDETGVIAPRLFGLGIAFPEKYTDPLGNSEHKVGINSFTEYALKVIPEWSKYKNINYEFLYCLDRYKDLFNIEVL